MQALVGAAEKDYVMSGSVDMTSAILIDIRDERVALEARVTRLEQRSHPREGARDDEPPTS